MGKTYRANGTEGSKYLRDKERRRNASRDLEDYNFYDEDEDEDENESLRLQKIKRKTSKKSQDYQD